MKKTGLTSVFYFILPLVLLILTIALFFKKLIFSNLILAQGDPFLYFYPYWHVATQAIRTGDFGLWNTDLFMGAPLVANSQVGSFYPLNWLVWLAFPVPYAYSASAFIHLIIGGSGAYLMTRCNLNASRLAAFFAAGLFSLGGYVLAQVEHINQLQGMAWLPWFFVVICIWRPEPGQRLKAIKFTLGLALLFSLQLLAGHLQAAFISGIGIVAWYIGTLIAERILKSEHQPDMDGQIQAGLPRSLTTVGLFALAVVFACALAAIQLAPTIELAGLSSRQGGLPANEVLSFSLHPLLLTRSLLPTYGAPLFIEYVAILPLSGLLLAVVGAWNWKKRPGIFPVIVITAVGLFLALGVFNPIYHVLARLPVFDLFRVPARWLLLYALGVSVLAAAGIDLIRELSQVPWSQAIAIIRRPISIGLLVIVSLGVWGLLAVPLSKYLPTGQEASVEFIGLISYISWGIEVIIFLFLLTQALRLGQWNRFWTGGLILIGLIVLFWGTRDLPFNKPTTPEAYFDQRPPTLRIETDLACTEDSTKCADPPERILSLSNINFDPGDQAEINTIYGDQLSQEAQYIYTVAVKQKEIIGPNLPMIYGLAAVDGFDGGVLPLKDYTALTSLILDEGIESIDGRLRENLSRVPDSKWLDLFNVGYLITDRVADTWIHGVFFDRQHPIEVADQSVSVGYIPDFEATEIWLLAEGMPGPIEVGLDGNHFIEFSPLPLGDGLFKVSLPKPGQVESISALPCVKTEPTTDDCSESWGLLSLALVDSRDASFYPLVPGNYRLLHSGDVKIYENLDVLPRAFLVYDWSVAPTQEEAIFLMQEQDYDPGRQSVITSKEIPSVDGSGDGTANITSYSQENVVIETTSETQSLLVLTDANYPGWKAFVDGEEVPIYQTNILFRGVLLPPGEHVVTMTFKPPSLILGSVITILSIGVWLSMGIYLVIRSRLLTSRKDLVVVPGSDSEEMGDNS